MFFSFKLFINPYFLLFFLLFHREYVSFFSEFRLSSENRMRSVNCHNSRITAVNDDDSSDLSLENNDERRRHSIYDNVPIVEICKPQKFIPSPIFTSKPITTKTDINENVVILEIPTNAYKNENFLILNPLYVEKKTTCYMNGNVEHRKTARHETVMEENCDDAKQKPFYFKTMKRLQKFCSNSQCSRG